MKGIIGGFVVLIGLMLVAIAFVAPTFSVINVQQSSSVGAPIENTTITNWDFSSTASWILSDSSLKAVQSTQLSYRIYQSQTITLNEIGIQNYATQGSSVYDFYATDAWINLTIGNLVLSYSLGTVSLYTTGIYNSPTGLVVSPTFTIPSGIYATSETLTITFVEFNGNPSTDLPYAPGAFSYIETTTGSVSSSGYLPYQTAIPVAYGFIYPMQNIGGYYVYQPENKTWVPLTKTTTITLSYTNFPVSIEFAYVENNGSTTDLGSMYLSMNGNNMGIAETNQTTVDGYTAYSILIYITQPGSYTINGYVGTTYNTNLQLMSFVYNTQTQGGSGGSIGTQSFNSTTLIIGFVVLVIGGLLIWRRK